MLHQELPTRLLLSSHFTLPVESHSVTEFLPLRDARMIVLFLVHLYEYCMVSHKKTNIALQLAFALTRQLGLDIARKELREFEAASRVGEKYFERLRGFG